MGCEKCLPHNTNWSAIPLKEFVPHTREELVAFFERMDRLRGMTEEEIVAKRIRLAEQEKMCRTPSDAEINEIS